MDHRYDLIVIGSGLGGLACGVFFAKEGYRVCVLERNKQIGGNLQTFVRDKVIFDSGVHYVGGLGEGQNLNKIFKYLGIMDKLKFVRMNEDGFDGIMFGGNPKMYRHAQGYEKFIANLLADFPGEEEALAKYCDTIKDICLRFPLYNLRSGSAWEKVGGLESNTKDFIQSITSNVKLQNVLAGSNLLYAGEGDKTPLYIHALIVNSYIEGAYRFLDGGSQIARLLRREITSRDGVVVTRKEVSRLHEEAGKIIYAECKDGDRYFGNLFVSNAHPAKTLDLTDSSIIKKVYRNRIRSLNNTISVFSINVVMKKNTFKYKDYNIYYFNKDDAWGVIDYKPEDWPVGFAMFFSTGEGQNEFAEGVTLMTYMRFEETLAWKDTFNTVTDETSRGAQYENFKTEKSIQLIDCVDKAFPGFKDSISSYYSATPLTLRDYIGSDDGSLYGITKDFRDPLKTFISARTKIPNLLLTGQNLNLHGVLGVSVSAIVTASEIFGMEYLIEKIRNA